VLTQALGGGVSSRLFQEIREKRGLAYSVYAYRAGFRDAGALALYAGTAPKNANVVLALLHEALDRLGDGGISERELSIAKGQVRGSLLLSLEDSGARMARLGRSQMVFGRVVSVDEVLDHYNDVSVDDVARLGKALAAAPRSLAAIGPFSSNPLTT
jgi:predicted Zn-dependent peptidase